MKNMHLLVWLTQLGLGTAVPLIGFVWLAVWLRSRFSLGLWVVFVGAAVGVICAIDGFYKTLKILNRMDEKKEEKEPPVSFGEHD